TRSTSSWESSLWGEPWTRRKTPAPDRIPRGSRGKNALLVHGEHGEVPALAPRRRHGAQIGFEGRAREALAIGLETRQRARLVEDGPIARLLEQSRRRRLEARQTGVPCTREPRQCIRGGELGEVARRIAQP